MACIMVDSLGIWRTQEAIVSAFIRARRTQILEAVRLAVLGGTPKRRIIEHYVDLPFLLCLLLLLISRRGEIGCQRPYPRLNVRLERRTLNLDLAISILPELRSLLYLLLLLLCLYFLVELAII